MIDLHSHILPGIDDGPETMADAVALARAARAAGTTTVVATPHVSWEWPQTTGLEIANAVLLLSRALREADVEVKVRRGAEVALTRAGDLPDGELQRLRLGAGPWMLVECPFSGSAAGFERALGALEARGHRILLAHPERIVGFQEDPALLERLASQGMLCQLTAGSLAGRYGRDAQRFSRTLLARGLVHVVASDAHSVKRRPPSVVPELQDAGVLDEQIHWLTELMPAAVLSGDPLPPAPGFAIPRGAASQRLRRS